MATVIENGEVRELTLEEEAELAARPEVVLALPRHITVLAFRKRFTRAERVALELAALDNPGAAMAVRQQAADLRVAQADLAAASYVDLDDPEVRTNVQTLEDGGLLEAGRALEILDAEAQDDERP
jgi:hypothetical protein